MCSPNSQSSDLNDKSYVLALKRTTTPSAALLFINKNTSRECDGTVSEINKHLLCLYLLLRSYLYTLVSSVIFI